MFNKITLYVSKTVLTTTFIMTSAILSLFIIFTFIAQLGDVNENYSTFDALIYVLFEIPANLYLILPICGLLGSFMGLGILSQNSELTILRAAGFSIFEVSKGVLLTGFFIASLTFIFGAYLGPISAKYSELNKVLSENSNNSSITDNSSIWMKDGNSFVKIEKYNQFGQLNNIKSFDIQNNQLEKITFAKDASYKNEEWVLDKVSITELNKEKITINNKEFLVIKNLLPPKLLSIINSNTEFVTLYSLAKYLYYSNDSQAKTNISLKFWQIIFQPLTVIVLMLVAVPFSFGSNRSSAMGIKIIIGFLLGFFFFITNQFFGSFTLVYDIPPFLGALLPNVIFIIILFFLFLTMKE